MKQKQYICPECGYEGEESEFIPAVEVSNEEGPKPGLRARYGDYKDHPPTSTFKRTGDYEDSSKSEVPTRKWGYELREEEEAKKKKEEFNRDKGDRRIRLQDYLKT